MEYKILTPEDKNYPQKLKERLNRIGSPVPTIYYSGPLEYLNNFTMAVISADSISGVGLMAANQLLFTIREYEMNYIGSWHSVMETEIFRLGLWKKCHNTVTLFSVKGLAIETFESFLLDRFYPPFDKFPEREEYFRRAEDGKLLILSVSEPNETRQRRKNIMERNMFSCILGDIVFVPYAVKGSKTYTVAKRIVKTNVPIFTTDCEENKDLHQLGITAYNRKTVRNFLEKQGAKLWTPKNEENIIEEKYTIQKQDDLYIKKPTQLEIFFLKDNKNLK